MKDFAIVIASHGDRYWADLAERRALPTALEQLGGKVEVYIGHDSSSDSRATVRNALAEKVTSDYIVFLDADDELAPGYVEALQQAWMQGAILEDWGPLLVPRVQYVERGKPQTPKFWPVPIEIDKGNNWMVVGTAVPRDLFFEVGGWREFRGTGTLNEYDDWDLWIRCQLAGAAPVKVPDAIYVAYIERHSAHRTAAFRMKQAWRDEILAANWPEVYA